MKDIVIIGAGGVGRETSWIIEQINHKEKQWNIIGYIDDNKEIHGKYINGYKILGDTNFLIGMDRELMIVCSIANYKIKKKLVNKIKENCNHKFVNIIHPDVYIHKSNILGEGNIIYPGVIMTTNINIGNHVIISPKCGIGHESIIEDYVSLLWNVNISGKDILKEGCLIGSGSTVIQEVEIGKDSIVGAGALVSKDIPKQCTAVGIPARPIKYKKN